MSEAADSTPQARRLRGRRALIGYAILGVVVFVTFLVANFPYSDTVTNMLAPYKLKLVCDDQRLSPPIGAELRGVRLISTAGGNDQALLDSPAVTLAPTFASLFLGRPGLHVRADLYGGIVKATIGQRAGITNLTFTLDALDLADGRPLKRFGAVIDGRLSGNGSAVIAGPNIPDNSGRLTLDGRQLSIANPGARIPIQGISMFDQPRRAVNGGRDCPRIVGLRRRMGAHNPSPGELASARSSFSSSATLITARPARRGNCLYQIFRTIVSSHARASSPRKDEKNPRRDS